MNRQSFKILQVVVLLIMYGNLTMFAQTTNIPVPDAPNPPRLVNDFAKLLQEEETKALESKLKLFSDSSSNQIAIVTVSSLGGYEIEDFSYALGQKWGIGKAGKDNGILVLVSLGDRKARIEVGKGLEGAVPDLISVEIIRNVLSPAFKQQQYYNGLNNTVDHLIAASKNEYQADPVENNDGGLSFVILLILFIIFIIYMSRKRGSGNYYMSNRGYRGWNTPWIGGGIGGSFFNGGSDSGSGDFGGFGGGSFGGGGASGDW
jgi:uncharacterized protein